MIPTDQVVTSHPENYGLTDQIGHCPLDNTRLTGCQMSTDDKHLLNETYLITYYKLLRQMKNETKSLVKSCI